MKILRFNSKKNPTVYVSLSLPFLNFLSGFCVTGLLTVHFLYLKCHLQSINVLRFYANKPNTLRPKIY